MFKAIKEKVWDYNPTLQDFVSFLWDFGKVSAVVTAIGAVLYFIIIQTL